MPFLANASDDILLKFFAFFEVRDLLTASKVCRSWRRVAHDSSLWSELNLKPYQCQVQEAKLLDILQNDFAPLGRKLSLGGFFITSAILKILFKKCRFLEVLNLKECKFSVSCGSGDFSQDELIFLKRLDLRGTRGYSSEIETALEKAINLECLGMNCNFPSRMSQSVFTNKPLLRMLDCTMCDWLNDGFIFIIAKNCPQLEYLSLNRCYNFTGVSLKDLLQSCANLRTLLLPNTRVDDASLLQSNWQNSSIKAIDIRHCSRVSNIGISVVLSCLPRIRYLRCALTDENFRLLQQGFPEVEVLQILRRYPVTIDIASNLLIGCPKITCLDISSVPFSHVHFEAFLPKMPALKWLSFAANECCGTHFILKKLVKYSRNLENLWIVYYHSNERDNVILTFKELVVHCPAITTVNLTGLYVKDLRSELEVIIKSTGTTRHIEILQNEKFILPKPEPNLDSLMDF